MAAMHSDADSRSTAAEHQAALRQVSKPVRRAPPSPLAKTLNHWIRRIHLYSGLLMLPWVFLYGVTGFLFNHPTFFASSDSTFFGPRETQGTPLEQLPTPAESAARLMSAINTSESAGKYELLPETASYGRGGLRVTFTAENGRAMSMSVDPTSQSGSVRAALPARGTGERGGSKKEPAPFERKELALDVSPKALLSEAAPALLANIGYANATKLKAEALPLTFRMTGEGQTWQVTYNEETGALTGEQVKETEAPAMPFRQFLLRMHLFHHYPSEFGVRWVFAVIVDVMSLTMIFWGVSGVIMWLQIKRTRMLGALFMLVGLVAIAVIGPLMYEVFTSSSGR